MATHPFDSLMELRTADIRLDCAALHLARDAYPGLVLGRHLRRLDELAEEVAAQRPGLSAPLRYEALRAVLVERCGLRGNEDDYYDPQNSYLNRVLERGYGIPISLSIVWIEVARRLKWPLHGLSLPGHFLVRLDDAERFVLIDPFRGGQTLRVEDCQQILEHCFEGRVRFTPEFLKPIDTRAILLRLLANLRNIYIAARDWPAVAQVLQRMAAVDPGNPRPQHELAGLLYRRGEVRAAYACLSAYLRREKDAREQLLAREELAHLEALIASLN